jgi:glycosyltransferase involved in cell wall biosynthesis
MPHIEYSVLVPVYNEADALPELCERVSATFAAMNVSSYELVIVDDGSADGSRRVLTALVERYPSLRVVRLRRNCGKSLALSAGFAHVRGHTIVTLDGDLQDHPEDIPRMLEALEGADLVQGWRTDRHDTLIRKQGSRLYNWFVKRVTGLHLHDMNCAVKAYRVDVMRALSVYGQYHRYIPLQAHLAGFRVVELPVSNSDRRHGQSKFHTFRYEGLFDLLSLLFLHKYGLNPMHFFGKLSAAVIAPSALLLMYFVVEQTLFLLDRGGTQVFNRPLLAFALAAVLLGGLMFTTGFVCDFVLHHVIRARLDGIISMSVASVSDGRSDDPPSTR